MLNTNKGEEMKLMNNSQALSALSEHYLNNDGLLYFFGANWYIQTGVDSVVVYSTGDRLNITKFYMVGDQAYNYIKNNSVKSMEKFLDCIRHYRDAVQGVL